MSKYNSKNGAAKVSLMAAEKPTSITADAPKNKWVISVRLDMQ